MQVIARVWYLLLRSFRYVFRSSCKEEFDKNLRVKKNSQINYVSISLELFLFLATKNNSLLNVLHEMKLFYKYNFKKLSC